MIIFNQDIKNKRPLSGPFVFNNTAYSVIIKC